ncbi:Wall-associated receptor kinase 2 [Bienertia sinuspersici]
MSYSSRKLAQIVVLSWVLTYLTPPIIGDNKPPSHSPQVIAPHCSDKCGNFTIPYPFGIEDGCFYEEHNNITASSFKINCSHNTSPPTPIFGSNLEVLNISLLEGELHTKYNVAYTCYNQNRGLLSGWDWIRINLVTFTLSSTKNILVALGCDTYAWFKGHQSSKNYSSGCMTTCVQPNDVINGECSGIGCCQASIPSEAYNVRINAKSFYNHSYVYQFNPCSVAFPVAKDSFRFHSKDLSQDVGYYKAMEQPIVINWSIGRKNCSVAKADNRYLCKENAECYDPDHELGYRCKCKQGYFGNAYLPHGCTDVDECKEANDCEKAEYCINTIGGYYCKCPKGYHGNGTKTDHCISNRKPWLIPVLATAGVGGGIITLLLTAFILHWKHGESQLKKMREKFFGQNGGLLLHEKLSRRHVDTLKIFTTQDLEFASNNYSNDNVIGRGGFGVVYKGVLPNNQAVAIKKSLRVDPNQVEQFVNEVLVLSQIKNKYVVKLLGCCLESEVPLLVYEFINNGTLYDHLNDGIKASVLKWPVRLKIASQVAFVLSYLHDTIVTPIIHRDVKSMNILLDECYTAKVTDFGASKLIPPDQHQFATMVLGTRGYLDPEYMQTSELNQKSDVYSFGVVLVELLTRKKAYSFQRPEIEKFLAMHFLIKMKEGCLFDILDKNIVSEGTIEEIHQVANLATWCLKLKGEERPTMKEVALELETIKRKGSHPWNGDGSLHEDCESLLTGVPRSNDYGGCSSGVESNVYNSEFLSSLEIGR